MASMIYYHQLNKLYYTKQKSYSLTNVFHSNFSVLSCQEQQQNHNHKNQEQVNRREIILRSCDFVTLAAIFHFSGSKPSYLGVQKNPASLALCPATNNCLSTSENQTDLSHYAPPWNYNPEGGRGTKKPVTREVAMQELLNVIQSTGPDNFRPKIMEMKDDYLQVEYESPIFGFVDDVEFWFPPGKKSIVEYRSASRLGNFDFDVNRKRIKALRQELEKKGWESENTY